MCEVSVEPGVLDSGKTLAFTNIVTWGEVSEDAIERVRTCFATYNWTLMNVEKVEPISRDKDYGDTLNELIEQATNNPDAVLCSTFHTYKLN
jgi:hypothetical protein